MAKHTLGDWEASGQLIITKDLHGHPNPKAQRSPKIIGEVHWDYDGDRNAKEPRTEWPEAEANQRLMIAAPDLLDALKIIECWLIAPATDRATINDIRKNIRSIIAKATGEST